jgi:glycosyltransferase involved in cell wall biosynthesis
MKILRTIHSIQASSGGPIEGLKQASKIMRELGVEVEVACLDAPDSVRAELEQAPWPVHALGPGSLGTYGYSGRMKAWLERNVSRFDAVIIHGNWQYHGFATYRACRKAKVPYFIYPHGMLDPWFNQTYPLKKLKKRVYWNCGEYPILKNARAVLFTCQEECLRARLCFKPYRVNEKVVGYGTNAPAYGIDRLRENTPNQRPYFLFLSRIQEKKGLDLLVKAYGSLRAESDELPDLLIAGPEQQPDYARELKTTYPQKGIRWIGAVHGFEKWRLLANAEALILPSHQENFGIVVAEALAVGTPPLISNKVNIHSEIESSKAGLVEEDNLDGTKRLLQKWNRLSTAEKDNMANAAKTLFDTRFDIRQATRDLLRYITENIRSDEPSAKR